MLRFTVQKTNMQQTNQPTPQHIMQIGMGFWASKTLLAAVHFGLFTLLSGKKMSGAEIREKLNFKTTQRHVYDFLDTLVSLGFLEREGVWDKSQYSNTTDTDIFLDENKPSFIGGILKMGNNRLYRFWGDLEEGLLTGQSQNETKGDLVGDSGFAKLYESPEKLSEFVNAMSGIQMGNFMTLVKKFNFSNYKTLCDVGGADGWLSIQVALNHPGIQCTTTDLKQVEPLANAKIAAFNLQDRIKFHAHDFLKDTIPSAEVISMGNIIHGMNEDEKKAMIKKVYDALPANGVFIDIENIIDNDRRQNTFGLMMSLNMLIENGDAFDYTINDFDGWVKEAGFTKTELVPLAGPTSAAIAYK
jgi:O-methyltransferase domain/Dimerisation domain